jgi:uncharacterized protein YhbP (UPF0306 family)
MDEQDKKYIMDYLSRYKLMSLGTYDKNPWGASVYYLYDNKFNFYFISDPATKHCKNIAQNPNVSITVADSSQKSSDKKVGFQAYGVAKTVDSVKELKNIIESWNKRGFVPITYKLFIKVWKSRFFKIKLTEVQMFDENQSEENEVRSWKL